MQKVSLQRGLPIPNEAAARPHCLHKGVDAPDLATVKDFLRFYIATSRGKIDEDERSKTATPSPLSISLMTFLPQPHIRSRIRQSSSTTTRINFMQGVKLTLTDAAFSYGSSRPKLR